jgi:PAS domain S-box-containing protein
VTSPPRAPRRPRGGATSASDSTSTAHHANGRNLGWDPDGGHGEVHDLLVAAVAEAARLLDADGAMVYLVDPATGHLRFAHDAGIRSRRSRAWVRSLDLPIGVGIFGRAVAERAVVRTNDYLADAAFDHAPETDRVVEDLGIRSMVAAPLIAGDTVIGSLGTFSSREDAFSPAQIGLVRALADHAAAAMHNVGLIEALDASSSELAKRADVERSLRQIGARISAAVDFPAVIQLAVDEAARLFDADGSRIELIDGESGRLVGAYASGALDSSLKIVIEPEDGDPQFYGVAGQAVLSGRPFWTGDYVNDGRFPRLRSVDRHLATIGIQSVMAAPLTGDGGPFGAIIVSTVRPHAWDDSDAGLLETIADQAAITIRTTRLIEELDRSREALGRRAQAEQALREIAARITVLREPSDILRDVVTQAGRLVRADGVILDLLDTTTGNLHWAMDDGLSDIFSEEERAALWISVGVGATGIAVAEGRVILADDDLPAQFPPSPESSEFYERTGFHSMIAAPITGDRGPLGVIEVYSTQVAAFTETDAGLVGALASQAAIAITNARLIEELDRSRDELSRTADAERTLREIAGRVSATHDQDEILQAVIDASVRLLGATGAMIDLLDDAGAADAWTSREAGMRASASMQLLSEVNLDLNAGVSGRAVRSGQVEWTGAYLEDDRFEHTPERDEFVRQAGIRSVISAPLVRGEGPVGAITVYGDRPDAFDAADAALLGALAGHAAVAIVNARLVEALERSRAEIARQADSERTLRQIAARVSAILEPDEVLQQIVEEATRLLESDGARIDLYDPEIDALRWSYAAGDAMTVVPDWALIVGLKPGQAVSGTAFAEQRPARTDDYLVDDRFLRDNRAREFVSTSGIRSVVAVPLAGDGAPLGTLSVVSREVAAFDDADAEFLTALATQASIAIRNARLIEELARSRAVIERRAEAEQALREIATRITAIRAPGDLLQRIVDEAQRLLRADGAVIDEYDSDEDVLIPAYDAGLTDEQRTLVRSSRLRLGEGLSGKAMAEGRVIAAGDYLEGEFEHLEHTDESARASGIGDLIVAPIIGDEGPLGAIEVYRRDRHAFDDLDAAVLGGLADQAAIAITNARLIEELERSQATVARRADTERALRDITARIAALREPDVILERVVEEARRLLGTDGAHLTRLGEDGTYLVPVVVAGWTDPETQHWLLGMRFPLGGGINGLAAETGQPVWTEDYTVDPRIPHDGNDDEVAGRLGLCGMAAAPLRAPGGEVIGTLAISTAQPRQFAAEELDLLQGLADQAAIAITNSTLLLRLTESEDRYRFLVENSPDVVFSTDAEGKFTFMSDAMERVSGWKPEEITGEHFSRVVDPASHAEALARWTALVADPETEQVANIDLLSPDGRLIPVEVSSIGIVDADGTFQGIHGATRDVSERARLERELRASDERYRYLVASSPDLVWLTDAKGTLTFLSDATRTMLGVEPDELIGQPYAHIFAPEARRDASVRFRWLARHPSAVHRMRLPFRHADGRDVMVEINGTGMTADGRFVGAHGAARDVGERDRLERDLRRQAGELAAGEERAHLARELHDSVTQALFSMTLVSRSVELLLDRDVEAARAQLAQLRDLQREALAEMRALIFELRPGNLEQDGLARALRTHTAALQGRIGLPIVVESALDERLPLAIEEVLYRISQEALHNVVKHASARQVRLEVGRTASGVRLDVHDDGKGFDPTRVPDGHLGLAGMRARADKIGAKFSVWSVPGEGTRVEVLVPESAIAAGGDAPVSAGPSPIRDA